MGSSQSQPSGAPKSAATHTPGPWFIQKRFRSIYSLSHGTVGTTTFITKPEGHQCGEDQADANAHLIAAAPDLLEEAREVCAILDLYRANTGEEPCFDHEAIGEEVARRHDSLTAAIAKATGQEVAAERDELAREGPASGMNPEKGAAR